VQFFTEEATSQESEVAGLRDSAGCFCGIFAYRLERDLLMGPILAVHGFTAVDVINSMHYIETLLDAAERRALKLGCAAVPIRLYNGQNELASRLRALGLSSEIGQFWKRIDAARSRN
jgi:hypothetical protein